jgi:hypothetical protein
MLAPSFLKVYDAVVTKAIVIADDNTTKIVDTLRCTSISHIPLITTCQALQIVVGKWRVLHG